MREATRQSKSIDCPRGHARKGWSCKPPGLDGRPGHVCGARHRRAHAGGKPVGAGEAENAPRGKPPTLLQRLGRKLLHRGGTA